MDSTNAVHLYATENIAMYSKNKRMAIIRKQVIIDKNIKYLREQKKISRKQLAEIISVSYNTVCRWEKGVIIPDCRHLCMLCDFFDVTVDGLVGRKPLNK